MSGHSPDERTLSSTSSSYGGSLFERLEHPNVDIKRRSMANILNKFKYGLMSAEMLENDENVLTALLKWFNNNPCFYYRQVIQLVCEFAKRKTSASILIEIGAIGFFQTLRLYAPEDIYADVDFIVGQLKAFRKEMESQEVSTTVTTETRQVEPHVHEEMQRYHPTSSQHNYSLESTSQPIQKRMTVKKIALMESDKQYLFEINIRLQQRRSEIIQEALQELKKSPLTEFPIECLVQNSDIIRSLTLILQNDHPLQIEHDVISCLCTIFEKLSLKIQDNDVQEADSVLIDFNSLVFILKYMYSKLRSACKRKISLIGKCNDVLKHVVDCFCEPISELDKLIVVESSVNILQDLICWISETMDSIDKYKILDLLAHLLSKCDSTLLCKISSVLMPTIEAFVFDPVLHLSFPNIHSKACAQLKRLDPTTFKEYLSTFQFIESLNCFDEITLESELKPLSSAIEHLERVKTAIPALLLCQEKNGLERLLQELFVSAEFLEDICPCQTLLKILLSHQSEAVRAYTIHFISEDLHFFFEKLASDELIYLICLHFFRTNSSTPLTALVQIIQHNPKSIKLFSSFIPLLQCLLHYCEIVGKTDGIDEFLLALHLFERVMSKNELIAYNIRFLFHKYKWIREAASTNLKTLLMNEPTTYGSDLFDFGESDPLMSIYLDDIEYIFETNSTTTDLASNEEVQSLLSLFRETKDFEIFKSVTSQLFNIVKANNTVKDMFNQEFLQLALLKLSEYTCTELLSLLFVVVVNVSCPVFCSLSGMLLLSPLLFHKDMLTRKLAFKILSVAAFSKDLFIREVKDMIVSLNNPHNSRISLPSLVLTNFYDINNSSPFEIECSHEHNKISTRALHFARIVKLFVDKQLEKDAILKDNPQLLVLKEIHPDFHINLALTKLSQSRSHSEFLTNLHFLQDYLLLDDSCMRKFEESDWRRVFLKFLHKTPTSQADDLVLENLIEFFSEIFTHHVPDKDTITELAYCYCKNFCEIFYIESSQSQIERKGTRCTLLKFLCSCLEFLCSFGCRDELKLLLNDEYLLISLKRYIEQKKSYDLRILALRCVCIAVLSGEPFSTENMELIKSLFTNLFQLVQEEQENVENGIYQKSHFLTMALYTLCSLSSVLRQCKISTFDLTNLEQMEELIFSKQLLIRTSGFQIISNGIINSQKLEALCGHNRQLIDLIISRISSNDSESSKEGALWTLCKVLSVSSAPFDSFIEKIPFIELFKLPTHQFLEPTTSLLYTILKKDPSSQSKILMEKVALSFLLSSLKAVSNMETHTTSTLNSLQNLLLVLIQIVENNKDLSTYLIKETVIFECMLQIIHSLHHTLSNENFQSVMELALVIMNNLVSNIKGDSVSDYVSSREGLLQALLICLNENNCSNLRLTTCKLLTTLLGRKCFPIRASSEKCDAIISRLVSLYTSMEDAFFMDEVMDGLNIVGKALAWLLSAYGKNCQASTQRELSLALVSFNKRLSSSLSIESIRRNNKEIGGSERLKEQLCLNLTILQQLLIGTEAKKVCTTECNIIQEFKLMWFSNYADNDLKMLIGLVMNNLFCGNERAKIDVATDLNKHQASAWIVDLVSQATSLKTKLSSTMTFFNLLTVLVSSAEVRFSMIKYLVFEGMIKSMKDNFIRKKDDNRLEYCLCMFSHLSFFEDCHELLLNKDTVDQMVDQLVKSPNENVKEYIMLIFRNLLFCKSISTLILRVEELVVTALRLCNQCPNNVKLQSYCTSFIFTYLSLYLDVSVVIYH
ncbi:hypothetical protein C9374_007183 [Naegleria lovaniensis]|uniref:Rotatin N-terminal domain-containing protein n=1 Tax=Naegleria lovaniensis TaxID=51637 RepID=A0AA88KRY7_NAELO|nr:uncharacterized protein C9374_007183 [Naegleria lovaniensis]KAG2393652.1 hypothetical protein C9374_007183 [Naegleria lovaniensis]